MFIERLPRHNYIQKYTTSDDDISNNLLPFFTIIVAYEQTNHGIGFQNRIPWHVPEDMNFFRKTTIRTQDPHKKNALIMGRKTWESLHKKPLDKRINICLTTSLKKKDIGPVQPDMFFAYSMEDALKYVQLHISEIESVFVIGGSQIYQEAIRHPQCNTLLINELIFEPGQLPYTDSFFPEIPENMYQELILIQKPIRSSRDISVQIHPRKFIRNLI